MGRRPFPGQLLVIEGPDGVGKTTICRALAEQLLSAAGMISSSFRFLASNRAVLANLSTACTMMRGRIASTTCRCLPDKHCMSPAHIDAIDRHILPALKEGKTILLDRYWWSTWVYSLIDGCSHQKLRALIAVESLAWGKVRPAFAVILRRPAPINRDDDPLARWQRLTDEYVRLTEREGHLYPVSIVDNVGEPDTTVSALLDLLDKHVTPTFRRLGQ